MRAHNCLILMGFLLSTSLGCAGSDDGGLNRVNGNSRFPSMMDNPAAPVGSGATGAINPTNGGLIAPPPADTAPTPGLDPNVCASASVSATRITPTVHFVIDGSSSMNTPFGGGSRWSVLRDALVGQNGVVRTLESVVKFGMTIYSNNDPNMCPAMTEVQSKLSNLSAMDSAYPAVETGGGTPTGEALQHVIDGLPSFTNMIDGAERPPIVILATDGEPNGCVSGVFCDWIDWANCLGQLLGSLAAAPATYDTTLAAVRSAKMKGIPVWVISLANGLNSIPDLQRTANIGAGLAENASPGATIYSPTNPDELTATLTKLLGEAVTCDVELKGTLAVERACEGSVMINGNKLPCNDDQGWKPTDAKHIQLQGESCAKFKSDPTILLDARFPCDVVVPD